ncbi:MAG: choice-of-anchor J domain-containing protein, partial [Candidatus Zixiibacteriota bacterium]
MVNCRKTIAFLLVLSLALLIVASAVLAGSKEEAAQQWRRVRSITNQAEQDPAVVQKLQAEAAAQAAVQAKLEAEQAALVNKPVFNRPADGTKLERRPAGLGMPTHTPRSSVFLFEDFESGVVPPAGWSDIITNPGAFLHWGPEGFYVYEGAYSAGLYYDPAFVPQDEWLISPSINLSTAGADIRVSFWWEMSYFWGVSPNDNYDLELWISTDGGATFPTLLWDETSEGPFSSFVWYNEEVSLAPYIGETDVVVAWRYVGVDGDAAFLDFIEVTDDSPTPPPANDDWASAEAVGDVTDYPFCTGDATYDGNAACNPCASPNIWYCYEATCDGRVTVDLCGSFYDTYLSVYDGCGEPTGGNLLVCIDDYCGLQSVGSFMGLAGNTYLIEIGGYACGTGCGDLSISCSVTQTGDNCSDPLKIDIPALPYIDAGQTTCGRGDDYNATCLGSFDGGEDIIYELTVLSPVVVDITLDPLGTDWTGIVIDDVCPPDGSCIGTSSNSGTTPHKIPSVSLAPGTYYIMVDTWPAPNCIPTFDLIIDEAAPAQPGDNCDDPLKIDIPALPYSDLGQTT